MEVGHKYGERYLECPIFYGIEYVWYKKKDYGKCVVTFT